ncbi:hypothetical protein AB0M48_05610 [Lentzea sp. NPDC051208]|uniref:hypothetical protein n=1 Tax=Lentzea sp. NPDC051208 TaxID=3154642 RepID=UPI003424DF40
MTGKIRGAPPFPASATVLARLSKGVGTGRGRPDVLGLALRIPTESGAWDLLLSTTGTGKWTRFIPMIARRWRDARLSTLTPYRYDGELVWFMALPGAGEPPAQFTLHASGRDAAWHEVAEVVLHSHDSDMTTAFDPVHNLPPELRLAPDWLAKLRQQAYVGSRRGRGESRLG